MGVSFLDDNSIPCLHTLIRLKWGSRIVSNAFTFRFSPRYPENLSSVCFYCHQSHVFLSSFFVTWCRSNSVLWLFGSLTWTVYTSVFDDGASLSYANIILGAWCRLQSDYTCRVLQKFSRTWLPQSDLVHFLELSIFLLENALSMMACPLVCVHWPSAHSKTWLQLLEIPFFVEIINCFSIWSV